MSALDHLNNAYLALELASASGDFSMLPKVRKSLEAAQVEVMKLQTVIAHPELNGVDLTRMAQDLKGVRDGLA